MPHLRQRSARPHRFAVAIAVSGSPVISKLAGMLAPRSHPAHRPSSIFRCETIERIDRDRFL
jgi:hypothetical protein